LCARKTTKNPSRYDACSVGVLCPERTVNPVWPLHYCRAQGFDDRYLCILKVVASLNDKLDRAGLGSVRHSHGVFASAFLRFSGARRVLAGVVMSTVFS